MSDTPRTEQAREDYRADVYDNPKGFCVAEPVHASFARELERENAELHKKIAHYMHTNNALMAELIEALDEEANNEK